MGQTPKLGLRWPELSAQADGPAAFQALATDTENRMTAYNSTVNYNGDMNVHVAPGAQTTVVTVDIPATVIGWAWIDVQAAIAVGGPQGGRVPATPVQNAGGQLLICNGASVLRMMRWHSRQRAEITFVGGGCPFALPPATTVLQLRLVMSTDSNSDTYGADFYTYNASVTQFGAQRT